MVSLSVSRIKVNGDSVTLAFNGMTGTLVATVNVIHSLTKEGLRAYILASNSQDTWVSVKS